MGRQKWRRHHDWKRALPSPYKPRREAHQGGGQGSHEGAVRARERGDSWSSNLSLRECAPLRSKFILCSPTDTVLYYTVLYCTVQSYCTIQLSTIQYCSVVYCTIQYNAIQYCTIRDGNVPAQNSPWGHFAAEIEFFRQFLCLLSFA